METISVECLKLDGTRLPIATYRDYDRALSVAEAWARFPAVKAVTVTIAGGVPLILLRQLAVTPSRPEVPPAA